MHRLDKSTFMETSVEWSEWVTWNEMKKDFKKLIHSKVLFLSILIIIVLTLFLLQPFVTFDHTPSSIRTPLNWTQYDFTINDLKQLCLKSKDALIPMAPYVQLEPDKVPASKMFFLETSGRKYLAPRYCRFSLFKW